MTITNTKDTARPITPDAQERKVVMVRGAFVLVADAGDKNKAQWWALKAAK